MAAAIGAVGTSVDAIADWWLRVVEFLDFPTLGTYLAACQRCLQHADAPSAWESWRSRHLDSFLPGHARRSSAADPRLAALEGGLRRARCVYSLASGVRLYEERRFVLAEVALRAALAELPGHEQLSCRLADALYARAGELAAAARQPRGSAPGAVPDGRAEGEDAPGGEAEEGDAEATQSSLADQREALLAEARGLYEQVFDRNPDNSYAVNGLALFAEGEAEKLRLLERAVELDGDNPYALANLAGHLGGKDDRRAVRCLDHALAVNPRLFYARLFRSRALLRLGDLDGAIASVREHLRWRPGDAQAEDLLTGIERQRALLRRQMLLV